MVTISAALNMPVVFCSRTLFIGGSFGIITVALWGACIWQILLRFKPDSSVTPTSPSPFPSPTPTPIPCTCLNNGTCQNGECICPNEWQGDQCQTAYFCESSTDNSTEVLSFNRILIGFSGYSNERCEPQTANAGVPKATRSCSENVSGVPVLSLPHIVNCNDNLENLAQQVNEKVTAERLLEIAKESQILTSQPEKLTAHNITSAAEIVSQILNTTINDTEQAAAAAVTTISQLLDASDVEFSKVINITYVTQSLTESLEAFSRDKGTNDTKVVQPNLAVLSATVDSASTKGVQFTAVRGTDNTLISRLITLNLTSSQLTVNKDAEVQIFIDVSSDNMKKDIWISKKKTFDCFLSFAGTKETGQFGFVLYQNDKFFKSKIYRSTMSISRRVISGSVANGGPNNVDLLFNPRDLNGVILYDYACVFWDYNKDDWSTENCSKRTDEDANLRCHCNHTTNFAVLMTFKNNYTYSEPLNWITYMGCGLSGAGLCVTILYHVLTRKSRKTKSTMPLVSICSCMLIVNILFITGIGNPNANEVSRRSNSSVNTLLSSDLHPLPDKGSCTAVTALLHYFLLGTFAWTSLYAVQMYMSLVNVFSQPPQHFSMIIIGIGWGLPAVVVAITLGATYRINNPLNYRQEEFCWLAALDREGNFDITKPMLWGFLLPVAIILIFNSVVFVSVMTCALFKKTALTSTKRQSYLKKLISSISVAVVLGITWVLGYLMLIDHDNTRLVFSYVFCIINTTQGLQIFIFFTARDSVFQRKMTAIVSSISPLEFHLHSKKFVIKRKQQDHVSESYKQLEGLSSTTSTG
ncbi:adhesion G-protein coupled receptor G7 [Polyodon spathula]|uniref:adhesion G-protein coupled receptor G7 n=1 Tax=Polyodon spathula TaxID=7913 RepID=UPI001B7EB546|nr:adhesion G-protein coupled receptor G7 [Polyodon spathula]